MLKGSSLHFGRMFGFLLCFGLSFLLIRVAQADITSGLLAEWKFDGNLIDSSQNGFNGIGYVGSSTGTISYQSGRFGQAAYFDGLNDWVRISHNGQLNFDINQSSYTISTWIKPASNTEEQTIMQDRYGGNVNVSYNMALNNKHTANTVGSSSWISSSNINYEVEAYQMPLANNWHLLTVTHDPTAGKTLYIDGSYVTHQDPIVGNTLNSTNTITIGGGWYGSTHIDNHYRGLVDDTRVYSRALSSSDVMELYKAPPSSPKLHVLCVGVDYHGIPFIKAEPSTNNASKVYNAVKKYAGSSWDVSNEDNGLLTLDYNISVEENKSTLQSRISKIASTMTSGDSFMLYYAGHSKQVAWKDTNGNWVSPNEGENSQVLSATDLWRTKFSSKADERLDIGQSEYADTMLSDDEFTSWFQSDDIWKTVDKTFIMDTCWAGGWFNSNPSSIDTGDLEKLNRSALMTNTSEDGFMYYNIATGQTFFNDDLVAAFNDSKTLAEVKSKLNNVIDRSNIPLENIGYLASSGFSSNDYNDQHPTTTEISSYGQPTFLQTSDYQGVVPEPASITLLALSSLIVLRRKKKTT